MLDDAPMEMIANAGMFVKHARRKVSWVSSIGQLRIRTLVTGQNLEFSISKDPTLPDWSWTKEDYIKAHMLVKESGKHNF